MKFSDYCAPGLAPAAIVAIRSARRSILNEVILVIDANFPWGAREILADLKKTTNKPVKFVWDTHYHADHAYGNTVFVDAGAAVVCSEDCGWESRAKGQRDVENQAKEGHSEPLEHPSVMFETRLVFDDGNQRVELTKSARHTQKAMESHICQSTRFCLSAIWP